jgi:hypothetical protein
MQANADGKIGKLQLAKTPPHPGAKLLGFLGQVQSGLQGSPGMVRIRHRRTKYRHHSIADKFINRAPLGQNGLTGLT